MSLKLPTFHFGKVSYLILSYLIILIVVNVHDVARALNRTRSKRRKCRIGNPHDQLTWLEARMSMNQRWRPEGPLHNDDDKPRNLRLLPHSLSAEDQQKASMRLSQFISYVPRLATTNAIGIIVGVVGAKVLHMAATSRTRSTKFAVMSKFIGRAPSGRYLERGSRQIRN